MAAVIDTKMRVWKSSKHFLLLWVWRVQQPGMIFNVVMSAINMTLLANIYMKWRFDNPYLGILMAFGLVMTVLLTVAYLWDAKGKFWVEQGEVVTARNPYMTRHMTAKEIVTNLTMWIPAFEALKLAVGARVQEEWTKKALMIDPKVKPICDDLIREFNAEEFIREKYPWYGG